MATEPGVLRGGCQCGAIRFLIRGDPGSSSVCYCRMCQKASAAFGLALVGPPVDHAVEWTRGSLSWFPSSNAAQRGFCSHCGTPLAYDAPDGLALSVMCFDDPDAVSPTRVYGIEGKRSWCDQLSKLPASDTLGDLDDAPFLATLKSNQHPDHETDQWTPSSKTR